MEKAATTETVAFKKGEEPDILPEFALRTWLDGMFPRKCSPELRDEISRLRKIEENALRNLEDELKGPNCTVLERLLVKRIVVIHAALYWEDHRLAMNSGTNQSGASILHDRVRRLDKRYLAAIKTLAEVRRLQAPRINVNLANQQVVAEQIVLAS